MYVKNWMLPQQFSVSSDSLAVEAAAIIAENKLKMLPVVDGGRLRGVVHRRDLSEAAMCVSGSGDQCEMNYFCKKLKVKDVMVRFPATVSIDDSVEDTLLKGRELTMSTFPVMDRDQVVGVVSDREIFVTLFKLLEAGKDRARITLKNVKLEKGTLTEISKIIDEHDCVGRAIFTVPETNSYLVRVVIRAECADPKALKSSFEARGFAILEFGSQENNRC